MGLKKVWEINITGEIFLVLHGSTYFLMLAILPQYLTHKSCSQSYNSTVCDDLAGFPSQQQTVQLETSLWLSMTYVSRLLPTILTLMAWGSFVDRVGQHKAMIVPPAVTLVQSVLLLLCALHSTSSQGYVVAITFLSSLHGDFPGALVLSFSYIASGTQSQNRSKRLTVLQGATIMTDMLTGFISGFVIEKCGYTAAFGVVASVCIVNIIFVIFFAKAIQHRSNASSLCEGDVVKKPLTSFLNPIKGLKCALKVVFHSEYKSNFMLIMGAIFFTLAATRGSKFIIVLFITNSPLNFSPMLVGYFLAYIAFVRGSGAIAFHQILTRCFKADDFVLLFFGLSSLTVHLILIAISKSTLMIFLAGIIGASSYIAIPVLRGMVTKLVDSHDAGKALSVTETVGVICNLLTSVIVTTIYRLTLDFDAGYIYFVLASFVVIALVITVTMRTLLNRGAILDPSQQNNVNQTMLSVQETIVVDDENAIL